MIRARNVGVWTQRIAIAAVVALIVGFAVRVGSTSSQSLSFRDPLVWLASIATGEVVQADSGSGEVTARVGVGSPNDSLAVLQRGPDALVLNRTTGELSRIDGATLEQVARSPIPADVTSQLIGQGDHVRVVTGSQVIPVDAATGGLRQPVDATGLTEPTVDDSGTVWAFGEGRKLVAVAEAATDVVLDSSTRPFALVGATGEAFLLDGSGPDLRSLDAAAPGVDGTHCVGGSVSPRVVAGGSVESGRVVVMVDPDSGNVRMSDRVADRCTSATIDDGAGQTYGKPVESNGYTYLPMTSTGEVIVVRVETGSVVGRSSVTAPGRDIELLVKDGTVWFNDPTGAAAGVLSADGLVTEIDKFRQVEVSAGAAGGDGSVVASTQPGSAQGGQGDPNGQGTVGSGGGSAQGVGTNDNASGPLEQGELSGLVADFTYSKGVVEVGEEVTFADRSQGGPTAWTWDFGDGEFSTGPRATHSWSAVGAYKVTLRIESPEGTAAASATIEVIDENTRTRPTADFRFSTSRVEVGQPVKFTDRTTGNPQTLEWDFGDGTTATGPEVEHSWSVAGTYRVSLTATNPLGSDTSEPAVITVFDRVEQPTAAIDVSTARAGVNQSITFTSRSTGNPTSLRWEFGDGTTATGEIATHSYTAPGRYQVKLLVSNSAGSDEDTVDITIDSSVVAPEARIVASTTTAEEGQAIRFTSLSINNPDRLIWDFGDGSARESGTTVTHAFSRAGTYRVTLIAENDAGAHSRSVEINVIANVPPPVAAFDFTPSAPVRAGQPVQFFDRSTGSVISEWTWDWGDGTPRSSQQNPTHVFADEGEYDVRLTVRNSRAADDHVIRIRVLPPVPRAEFTWNPTRPNAGQAVQFTDRSSGSGIDGWEWNFGDGTSSAEQSPRKTFNERGSFTVMLRTHNAGGWSEWRSQRVDVNPRPPVAAFDMSPSSGITTATSVTFRYRATAGSGEPDSYVWIFSDGERMTGASVTRTFSRLGDHTVTLEVTNTGGSDRRTSSSFRVVAPPPDAAFEAGAERLVGRPITLTNRSTGAVSYSWSANGGTFSSTTAASPTVTFSRTGRVEIVLTATNASGQTDTQRETIEVFPVPTAAITAPTGTPIAGTPFQFNGTVTGGDAMWSFSGPGGSDQAANGRLTFPSAGTYTVTLTVTNAGGGRATAELRNVRVDPPAPVAAIEAVATSTNGVIELRNASSVGGPFADADVRWNFGDGSPEQTGNVVRHEFDGEREYTVTLTVRNVTGTDTETFRVPARPTASFTTLPPPNPLTPTVFTGPGGAAITGYEWFVNGEREETDRTFTRSFAAGADYEVSLRVRNLWGWSELFTQTYEL